MKKLLILFALSFVLTAHAQNSSQNNTVTLFEFIRLNEGFSTLTTALEETGLDVTLQEAGPFTLFAPTDAAFAALPEGRRNALLGNPNALKALLNRLIVPEKLAARDLLERAQVETAAGSALSVGAQGEGNLNIDGVAVVASDVGAAGGILISNGVIQVIDALPASLR